jgi:hypothetical protein
MKIGYRLAVAVAAIGVLGAASLMAAGPASASALPDPMCVYPSTGGEVNCAVGEGQGATIRMLTGEASSQWYVPTSADGQIRLYGFDECMQENEGDSSEVQEEPCDAKASEEWGAISDGSGFLYANKDTSGCLNDDVYTGNLNVATCNYGTNEIFYP